ncbi:Permeases of the drug/metabolite transporter (DMT) superfamily [Elusimicrobium minutum Pei191]|uniref:Permeases of the drug/metabolite transporter (DMT) superfamily n=1 Tax=Elusimicrobium minutum (strain Pei191) TaxID=445932 RepID=B2KBG8_ELUMP|nr:DMT family transporter [Elusimicrobium minutum]ACC97990.1 Permeases of the drug/metabolite transporter (DMT) superfamily [Elusimicrobium minutum Pei191]
MNPLAALWLCWVITAFSPIIGKYAMPVAHPVLVVFSGSILAVIYFAPAMTKKKLWGKLFDKKTLGLYLVMGTFGTALPFSIMLFALNYTTPANAAILNQTEIIYSLILTSILLKERPSLGQLGGSFLVILGVAAILLNEHFTPRWKGDLIIIGSVWLFQISHIAAKKLPEGLDYTLISAARSFWALPATIILILFMWPTGTLYFKPGFQAAAVIGATGIFKYGIAMLLWYTAIRNLDLSKVTAIILSYPALSFILSVLLGFEKPQTYQIIGLVLTFAGAYWVTHVVKKQNAKKENLESIEETI